MRNLLRRGPWRKLSNRDALYSLGVTLLACAASLGLLYLVYLVRCVRIARQAPIVNSQAQIVLLFGKRLASGVPDADYVARIERTHALLQTGRITLGLLLGGQSAAATEAGIQTAAASSASVFAADAAVVPTEAAAALALLQRLGVPATVQLVLEDASVDTLQNLRNARALLAERHANTVVLVSSRYHLARCALFARNLGFDAQVCAAEPTLRWRAALVARLALEAAYLMWIDIGTRWAQWLGHRRMLDQVT